MYFFNLGYFAVADDAILNFWQPFNLDLVFHQMGNKFAALGRGWWTNRYAGNLFDHLLRQCEDQLDNR